jgi:hypothetical protein
MEVVMSRKKKVEDPILITGAARSRTSLTAGIVHFSGAWGGEMSGPTPFNKKGMFENAEIRNHITKPYLMHSGLDPMCQNPLPDVDNLEPYAGLKEDVVGVIVSQGYDLGPWFYKGAKMCLLWPLWHKAFPDAKWVIVRRAKEDIVQSCLRTSFMRKLKGPDAWRGWVEYHEMCFEQMKGKEGLDVMEVDSDRLVGGDLSEIKEVIKWLGLTWKEKDVTEFIDPSLTIMPEPIQAAEVVETEMTEIPVVETEEEAEEVEENGV